VDKWIKFTWAGLKAVQLAQTITKVLKIHTLRDYIDIFSVYPPLFDNNTAFQPLIRDGKSARK
jgi:hypothetical protein